MQLRPIQFTLNFVQHTAVVCTIFFWPICYCSILKPKEKRRSLWEVLKNPDPPDGPKASKLIVTIWQPRVKTHLTRNKIVCLNQNKHVYSHYQIQGAFAHLNQKTCKDFDEALAEACAIKYYEDPLHLALPYQLFVNLLPEPPDIIPFAVTYTICIFMFNIYGMSKILDKADLFTHYFI